ncbi:MAG: hypothetical protein DMG65_16105 [Candidatus Angelobacter sp. Gp1-AA117]|nr:MAG: hypothetical protein DMG65_16105 [Candidatus Angelobacter sp. Gp1-AA117]
MPNPTKIQMIVEEAVAAVFEAALPALRTQIVNRTVEELQSLEPAPGNLPSDLLNAAAALIQESPSQAEILRHLLEGAARFCGRAALFVVRAGAVTGWQGIGFENNDTLKSISLNGSAGPVARSIQERATVTGPITELDADFVTAVGPPADGSFVVLPLVVKEKVAALIYADGGAVPDNRVDISALTLLCRFTGLWLELTALRKAGITAPAEESQQAQPQSAATAAAPAPQPAAAAAAAPAGEEDEVHKKARRFARLLVDEIKLYNQAKVSEGKQNRDLYQRLRDDIEKSRATYENRFGSTPAASGNYFTQELIRVLADNDIALMGGNFPQ